MKTPSNAETDKVASLCTYCQKSLTLNTKREEKKKIKQLFLSPWKMLEVIDSRLFKFINRRA